MEGQKEERKLDMNISEESWKEECAGELADWQLSPAAEPWRPWSWGVRADATGRCASNGDWFGFTSLMASTGTISNLQKTDRNTSVFRFFALVKMLQKVILKIQKQCRSNDDGNSSCCCLFLNGLIKEEKEQVIQRKDNRGSLSERQHKAS